MKPSKWYLEDILYYVNLANIRGKTKFEIFRTDNASFLVTRLKELDIEAYSERDTLAVRVNKNTDLIINQNSYIIIL